MKKKRKVLATWKVVLITIAAIIGLLGVSTFVMYLLGYFENPPVNPEDMSFAQTEEYNATTGMYEVSEDFYMTINTTTENVNVTNVTLSLGTTEAQNGYIDNGIIRVPQTVRLNTPFLVTLSTDYNAVTNSEYINGGITTLRATSDNRLISPITTTIAVDVPVYEISAFVYDTGDETMTPIIDNEVINGSEFKIGLNFSPNSTETGNSSEFMYGGTEKKMVFFSPTNRNIEFNYETQTFTANGVSAEGYPDSVTLYTFTSASYQKAFLSENQNILNNFAELNQAALHYFGSNPSTYRSCSIEITVKDVGVESFSIGNTQFKCFVDKFLNISSNSSSSVFDGSLNVSIRDDEGNSLNSIYAGNVGIALTNDNTNVKIDGEGIVRVVVTTNTETNTTNYEVFREAYNGSLDNYSPSVEQTETGTVTTYYFILPKTSQSSSAANYSYGFASTAEGRVDFKVALFVEGENGWEIFFENGNSFSNLPSLYVDFTVHQEQNIYWAEEYNNERIIIVYDSDTGSSDTVELSEQIVLPTENVYQRVRYFFYSPTGAQIDVANSLEYASCVQYTVGEDIDLSGLNNLVSDVWLYELNDSNLTAIGPLNQDVNLVFVTVRTNADGVILNSDGEVYESGDKYDIVQVSAPRAIVVDATLKFEDMTGETSFSSVDADQFKYTSEENNYLYVPALFYSDDLGNSDSFEITITLNNASANMISVNELQDLYNAGLSSNDTTSSSGYIRVEFRDENGNLGTYLDEDNLERSYFEVGPLTFAGTETITGTASVSISEKFSNTDGIHYTPYLVYYNGRTIQEKEMSVNYAGENYDGFTIYAQLATTSEYSFVDGTQYAPNGPITVSINEKGERTITWASVTGGTITITDSQNQSALEHISSQLSVVIYDQIGKVIKTNAASFTLQEGTNGANRYINIVDNQITGFNSTGGDTIETFVTATISSIYGTTQDSVSPGNVNFSIFSAGVREVLYDKSEFATSDPVYEFDPEEDGDTYGAGKVTKYFTLNDQVILNDLLQVYIGDSETPTEEGYLKFRLNTAYLASLEGHTSELFSSQGAVTNYGMISLKSDTSTDASSILSYTSQQINVVQLNYLFAEEFSLIFDVYDDNGLVNIQLTLVFARNINYSDSISSYSSAYADYLTYGDVGNSASKLVFGGDSISLNQYLPLNYIRNNDNDTPLSWTGGDVGTAVLYIDDHLATEADLVYIQPGENNLAYLEFSDVKTLTYVQVTLYYNRQSTYSLRIDLGFVINPNYLIAQKETFVDLSQLGTQDYSLLENFYTIYNAKEYINRHILNVSYDDPTEITFENAGISFTPTTTSSILNIRTDDGFNLDKEGVFVGRLGQLIDSNINLFDLNNENNAFQFILARENGGGHEIIQLGYSTLNFHVGYGETAEAVVNAIINTAEGTPLNYEVLSNNEDYVLVLLELNGYSLNNLWTVEEDSASVDVLNSVLSVGELSTFNVSDTITFVYNNEDRISADVRLSKVGLIYVAYKENYNGDDKFFAFEDITTDETSEVGLQEFFNNLSTKGIYDIYTAGKSYTIVSDNENSFNEELDVDARQYGFYYRRPTNTSLISATLSLRSITAGYEDILSIDNAGTGIILNSLVDTGEEVYAILQLSLSQNLSSGNVTYVMYYRIKINPNYSLGNVTYPYNNDAEYIEDTEFTINFEKPFTTQDASVSNDGKYRFANLEGGDGEEITFKYSVDSVIINGEEYSDFSTYLDLSIDERNGVLSANVIVTDASIEIIVAKTYYIKDGEVETEVVRSQRLYTIKYHSDIVPIYDHSVTGEQIEEDGDNYIDNSITINDAYNYTITVQERVGDIYTPSTDVFAHITYAGSSRENGEVKDIETYLYDFVRLAGGDQLYTVVSADNSYTLSTPYIFNTENGNEDNYVLVDLTGGEVTTLTTYAQIVDIIENNPNFAEDGYIVSLYKDGENLEGLFYLPKSRVNYFDFRNSTSNGVYELTFKTRESIEEDGTFKIGIYTSYLNIFDITFNMNGGYQITYDQNFGGTYVGGKNYNVTDFIDEITKGDEILLDSSVNAFTFTECTDVADFEIVDNNTFSVAHSQETIAVEIKAEHNITENLLTIASGTNIYRGITLEGIGDANSQISLSNELELAGFTYTVGTGVGEGLNGIATNYIRIDLANPITVNTALGTQEEIESFYIELAESEITKQSRTLYSFFFSLMFAPSNDIAENQTVAFRESESIEGIRYSQNTITLNLREGRLYDMLVANFSNNGTNFRTGIDSFAFENGTTTYTITLPNVGERRTDYVENITIQYRFNNNIIYRFGLNYIFAIEPNVEISDNYPTPNETANMQEEYVDNKTTIEDFFNTSASFAKTNASSRLNVTRKDADLDNQYNYDYNLDITTITNVVLTVNGTTSYNQPTPSLSSGSLSEEGGVIRLPDLDFTFTLNNTGTIGRVMFTLQVNSVTKTYTVIVNNNNTVTIETNMITRVDNYEEVFAEDLSTYDSNKLFSYNRLFKYQLLNSASGTYFVRFDAPIGSNPLIREVQAGSTAEIIVDLGDSYNNYTYNGIYSDYASALSGANPSSWTQMFAYQPQITNRIVLLYAGYEVNNDIADIRLSERINPKLTYTIKDDATLNDFYYLRFNKVDDPTDYVTISHSFQEITGQSVTDTLDASLEGYYYQGAYLTQANAENAEAKVTNIFEVEPSLSEDGGLGEYKELGDVSFSQNQVGVTSQYHVGYVLTNGDNGIVYESNINNVVATNSSYRLQLNVQFEVTSDALSHYEILEVADGLTSIYNFPNFGIRDAKTGNLLTSNDIGENRRIDLAMYGFGDAQIMANSDDPLEQEAWQIHDYLTKETTYNTGINPRYGAILNGGVIGTSDDQTQDSNYASLNAGTDYGANYQILPRGAAVNGNFIMLRITYTTFLDKDHTVPVSVSANLRFLIMPSYDVEFRSSSESTQYSDAIIEDMEIDGENVSVATNTAGNPYIITRATNSTSIDRTQYLYKNSTSTDTYYPIWRAMLGSDNQGFTFSYSIPYNGSQAEYNSYFSAIDTSGTGWSQDSTSSDKTHSPTTSNGEIKFTAGTVSIGDKSYYIDAVDSFGYRARIYFRIESEINPVIAHTNVTTVTEGNEAEIGATYNTSTFAGGTLNNVTSVSGGGQELASSYQNWAYDYSYTIQNADGKGDGVQIILGYATQSGNEVPITEDIEFHKEKMFEIVYAYTASSTTGGTTTTITYATSVFDKIPEETTSYNVYVNYLGNDSDGAEVIKEILGTIIKEEDAEEKIQACIDNANEGFVFGLQDIASKAILTPNGYLQGTTTNPTYGSSVALQMTISGLYANVYDSNVIPAMNEASFNTEFNAEVESNVYDINVASVWFEIDGDIVFADLGGDGTYGYNTTSTTTSIHNEKKKLVTSSETNGGYVYEDGTISEVVTSGDSDGAGFKIPYFPGKYYGESTTLENVVMVVNFVSSTAGDAISLNSESTEIAQVRQTLTIQRADYGNLVTQNFIDDDSITMADFNTTNNSEASSITVTNDTLEIEISAGGSLEYAIVSDNASPTNDDYKPLTNNENYAQREQIRISKTSDLTSGVDLTLAYGVYIRNASEGTDYKVKYFGKEPSSNGGKYDIELQTFNENNGLKLNIVDVDELNSSGYATRYIYTISNVTYGEGTSTTTEHYQQTDSIRLYPHFQSISANRTSAHDYIVDDYYKVTTETGTYYVISPTSWAGQNGTAQDEDSVSDSVIYNPYFQYPSDDTEIGTWNNEYRIAEMPYIFSYEVVAGATIDSMGTITTNEDFRIQSDNIMVNVYMRVSGIDGLYNDPNGIRLTSTPLTFYLRNYANNGTTVQRLGSDITNGIYGIGANAGGTGPDNSLVILNDGDKVYAMGGANVGNILIGDPTTVSNTYLIPTNEPFVFEDNFEKTTEYRDNPNNPTSNNEFRIIKQSSNSSYMYRGNLDSYTYTTAGVYESMFIESYRYLGVETTGETGSFIYYSAFKAQIIVYNSQVPTTYSAEYSLGGEDTSSFEASGSEFNLTLKSPNVTDNQISMEEISMTGSFYDVATGKQIVNAIADDNNAVDAVKDDEGNIIEDATRITFDRLLESETSGIKTKEIVSIEDSGVKFYRITFFVYESGIQSEELALQTNNRYVFANLFGNGTFYQLNDFEDRTVTEKSYNLQPNNEVKEIFYVFVNNRLTKHEVTFKLYSSSNLYSLTTWVEEDSLSGSVDITNGETAPTEETGGQLYINTTANSIYQKINGNWYLVSNSFVTTENEITGWLFGNSMPAESVGEIGNVYIDQSAFMVYQKAESGWLEISTFENVVANMATITVAGVDESVNGGDLFDRLGYQDVIFDNGNFTRNLNGTEYTYKLYEVSSINTVNAITSNSYIVYETNLNGTSLTDWQNTTRTFFVEENSTNGKIYRRFSVVFYKYADIIEINAITEFNNQFMLRNLDQLVRNEIGGNAEVNWRLYDENNYTLSSITNIRIDESTVGDDGLLKDEEIGQFYVLVANKYYHVNLNITCAETRGSYQVYVANKDLENEIDPNSIQLYTFDSDGNIISSTENDIATYQTISLVDYINFEIGLTNYAGFEYNDVKFYVYNNASNSISAEFDKTELSTIDLTGQPPFVKNMTFIYYINYSVTTGESESTTRNLYAILNVSFVVQNEPLSERHFFSSTTSGATFDLNTLTTQVRQRFELSSTYISYYIDNLGEEQVKTVNGQNEILNLYSLTDDERQQNYILKVFYINVNENFEPIILILQNTNILTTNNSASGGNI